MPGNDTRFCREHAFAGNPLFRVSSILAPERSRQLTALYALFDLLQRIGRLTQDEGAARVQLAWWRQECLASDPGQSSHPALRELHLGGPGRFDQAAFAQLIEQIELRLEQPPMSDVDALLRFCEAQGRPYLALETGLWQAGDLADGVDTAVAARRGLLSLLTDCFLSGEPMVAWWAPLDLLAREGLQRVQVFEADRAPQAARMFAGIFASGAFSEVKSIDISDIKQPLEHVHLMDLLVSRKQRRLSGQAAGDYSRELSRVRVSEFLAAWSLARRISRRR